MTVLTPPNAADVRAIVEKRLKAVEEQQGVQESVTIEWRGQPRSVPVITMPVSVLSYNPATHRIRAQRSLDPKRDRELAENPFGPVAQDYLGHLLKGDPTDPQKTDPSFEALKEDIRQHGQNDPGIITRDGVLINANTRCAALRELAQEHIRVGVLPPDAGLDDLESIELSLQLRRDHKRDYSFVNFLLAVDERVEAGRLPGDIQRDFRIKSSTYERSRWILQFIREAISRSEVEDSAAQKLSMRLVDFETHQGKLEELHTAYSALKSKAPADAEALREQRLLALAMGKSKTDLRLIEPDFIERYMKDVLPPATEVPSTVVRIPGTKVTVPGPSPKVQALRELTNQVLQAKAVETASQSASPGAVAAAGATIDKLNAALEPALEQAGKRDRLIKRRFAAADRLSDANEDLSLLLRAVAEAKATSDFKAEDLDDTLIELRKNLAQLARMIGPADDGQGDGVAWLRALASLPQTAG
jgi:hypothetical protein